MNMENITSLRSYIDYEIITVFSSNEEYREFFLNMLRKQSRSVRVAESRSRLRDKINLKSINNALNNEDKEGNLREVSCQTTISIPPFDNINDEVLSSIGDVDDLSLSSDDENYRNCVIKRITRKPSDQHIHLRQDMSYIDLDDRENYNKNINNLDNDDKDKKLGLFNRDDNISTNFCEDVFVWECEFRQGIREYDSPIFTFCALKFRLSLLNIDNANKILISLLNREKDAKLKCVFKIHSLLTTLTRSNDDDFHFSQNTGFHHGLKVGDIDLLTFLEFGKIKFSATLRTRIDKVTGSLIGNA